MTQKLERNKQKVGQTKSLFFVFAAQRPQRRQRKWRQMSVKLCVCLSSTSRMCVCLRLVTKATQQTFDAALSAITISLTVKDRNRERKRCQRQQNYCSQPASNWARFRRQLDTETNLLWCLRKVDQMVCSLSALFFALTNNNNWLSWWSLLCDADDNNWSQSKWERKCESKKASAERTLWLLLAWKYFFGLEKASEKETRIESSAAAAATDPSSTRLLLLECRSLVARWLDCARRKQAKSRLHHVVIVCASN